MFIKKKHLLKKKTFCKKKKLKCLKKKIKSKKKPNNPTLLKKKNKTKVFEAQEYLFIGKKKKECTDFIFKKLLKKKIIRPDSMKI